MYLYEYHKQIGFTLHLTMYADDIAFIFIKNLGTILIYIFLYLTTPFR